MVQSTDQLDGSVEPASCTASGQARVAYCIARSCLLDPWLPLQQTKLVACVPLAAVVAALAPVFRRPGGALPLSMDTRLLILPRICCLWGNLANMAARRAREIGYLASDQLVTPIGS